MKNKIYPWLRYGIYLIYTLFIIEEFLMNEFWMFSTIGILIALFCAEKCFKLAKEINKSINLAYFIGAILGLIGLLIYYIYYRIKRKV